MTAIDLQELLKFKNDLCWRKFEHFQPKDGERIIVSIREFVSTGEYDAENRAWKWSYGATSCFPIDHWLPLSALPKPEGGE